MSSRARDWVRRAGVVSLTASAVLFGGVGSLTAANADQPVKVGWWNAASSGGQAAPAPDVNAGGMKISVSGSQVLAFGAVAYNLPADGTATLELTVTNSSPEPSSAPANPASLPDTNVIVACPTTDNNWSAGDSQDPSTAPKYDCTAHHYVGALSSDGKTMTFLIDGSADLTPGTLSLAILPDTTTAIYELGTDAPSDVTPPYFIDFDKPSATAFTVTGGSSNVSTSAPPPPPPPVTSSAGAPSTSGSVPPATGSTPPNLPSSTTTAPTQGQTPVVAGNTAPQGNATAPMAATKSTNSTEKNNLAWGLLLLLLAAVVVTSMNRQRAPRIIAGPGATATATTGAPPADAAAAVAAAAAAGQAGAAPAWMAAMFTPRGLGRFAKPRTTPARPLV
jgi:hypothetical protein